MWLKIVIISYILVTVAIAREYVAPTVVKAPSQIDCTSESCPTDMDELMQSLEQNEEVEEDISNMTHQEKGLINKPESSVKNNNVLSIKDIHPLTPQIENTSSAKLIILNKITTKPETVIFKLKEAKFFGNLSVEIHRCVKTNDLYRPNNLILISVFENKVDDDKNIVFHGWLLSNNPSVSTLEHPVYEIIAVECI